MPLKAVDKVKAVKVKAKAKRTPHRSKHVHRWFFPYPTK